MIRTGICFRCERAEGHFAAEGARSPARSRSDRQRDVCRSDDLSRSEPFLQDAPLDWRHRHGSEVGQRRRDIRGRGAGAGAVPLVSASYQLVTQRLAKKVVGTMFKTVEDGRQGIDLLLNQ
jgi:hypothetical protein